MVHVLRAYYFFHDGVVALLKRLAFISPLMMRLYLAPVMIAAGLSKVYHLDATAQWFEHSLGLPEPMLMAQLAAYTELIGGFCLLFGFALRWACIPLLITMAVAAVTVHWPNGWFAIAPSDPLNSAAKPLADIGLPAARESLENSVEVGRRLERASAILQEHGNYPWLTAKGNFVVLNNGIEFAATYFIMLLALLISGAGRWLSLDFYLDRQCRAAIARYHLQRASQNLQPEPEPEPEPEPSVSTKNPSPVAEESMPDPKPQASDADVGDQAVQDASPDDPKPSR